MYPLFLLDGAEFDNAKVNAWLQKSESDLGKLCQKWFSIIRQQGSDVQDLMHDGAATACLQGAAFSYVAQYQAHVNIGFFRGFELPDPNGLLQGTGKYMRHVKLMPNKSVDDTAIKQLVFSAYQNIKSHLNSGP